MNSRYYCCQVRWSSSCRWTHASNDPAQTWARLVLQCCCYLTYMEAGLLGGLLHLAGLHIYGGLSVPSSERIQLTQGQP